MYKCSSGLGWNLSGICEGESHSLTDATWLLVIVWFIDTVYRYGSTLGEHNGTF